jgi:hypothetical protein
MYSSTHSLTSALRGTRWSASRPDRFIHREKIPGTHWIGGWVSPKTYLDAVVKRKIPSPRRESNPDHLIVQPVAQRYTDWAIPAVRFYYVIDNNRALLICNNSLSWHLSTQRLPLRISSENNVRNLSRVRNRILHPHKGTGHIKANLKREILSTCILCFH